MPAVPAGWPLSTIGAVRPAAAATAATARRFLHFEREEERPVSAGLGGSTKDQHTRGVLYDAIHAGASSHKKGGLARACRCRRGNSRHRCSTAAQSAS